MRGSNSFPDCSVDEEVPTLGAVPNLFKASPATGELVGYASNNGVTLDLRGSLEKMRDGGIRGRLMKYARTSWRSSVRKS